MPLWLEDAAESGWEPPTVAALAALVGLTLPLSSSGHLAGGQLLWPQSGPPWGARIPGVGTGRGKRAERFYFIFWESEGLFYRACFPLWVRRIQKEKKNPLCVRLVEKARRVAEFWARLPTAGFG